MQQTTWGWLIIIYLFLGGLGSGAFLCSVLAYKGYLGKLNEKFHNFGFKFAPICVAFGTFLLLLDLAPRAATNPLALMRLYTHPTSMMSLGTYLLTFFIVISFIVFMWVKNNKALDDKILFLGAFLAVGVMGYTGLLLYVIKAIPLWASIWLPILFTISAISTGLSINSAFSLNRGHELTQKVKVFHIALIVLEIIAVMFLFAMVSSEAAGLKSVSKIVGGSLAPIFWIGFVFLGLLLPLFDGGKYVFKNKLVCKYIYKNKTAKCQSAEGCCELKNQAYNEYLVLIGGLCLRIFIIFGAFYIF